jgi:hypothetical protein
MKVLLISRNIPAHNFVTLLYEPVGPSCIHRIHKSVLTYLGRKRPREVNWPFKVLDKEPLRQRLLDYPQEGVMPDEAESSG